MLTITPEQYAVLEARAVEDFYRRAAEFFREEFADDVASMDDRALVLRLKQAACKAARYGIETEQGIVYYGALDLLLGHEFDSIPEIADVLNHHEDSGDERIEALFAALGD